jgi:hypothetical protein
MRRDVMNPRFAFAFKLLATIVLIVALAFLFPPVMRFVELAARELVYFWWLMLLLLLAAWLIWGLGGRKK